MPIFWLTYSHSSPYGDNYSFVSPPLYALNMGHACYGYGLFIRRSYPSKSQWLAKWPLLLPAVPRRWMFSGFAAAADSPSCCFECQCGASGPELTATPLLGFMTALMWPLLQTWPVSDVWRKRAEVTIDIPVKKKKKCRMTTWRGHQLLFKNAASCCRGQHLFCL